MRITNYGKDVVLKVLFVTLILDAAAYLIDIAIVKIILFVISLVIFLLTLYFFRDPDREPPENISDDTVLSPADGKVVLIEDIENIYRELFPSGRRSRRYADVLVAHKWWGLAVRHGYG